MAMAGFEDDMLHDEFKKLLARTRYTGDFYTINSRYQLQPNLGWFRCNNRPFSGGHRKRPTHKRVNDCRNHVRRTTQTKASGRCRSSQTIYVVAQVR